MPDERVELERIQSQDEAAPLRPGYPHLSGYGPPYGYGYGVGESEGLFNFRDLLRALRKRKWLILGLVTVITAIVTLEVYRGKNIYLASATVEIGKDTATLMRSAGETVIQTDEFYEFYQVDLVMKTKIRQLMSRPLLEDVTVSLRLDRNPDFLLVGEKRSHWEALQAIADRVRGKKQPEPETSMLDLPIVAAEAESARSAAEHARLAPYVDVLGSNISATPIEGTAMLMVSFTHTDPVIAASVANALAETFINRSFESKTAKFNKTSAWLDSSTRELKAKVEQAEQALADYTRAHNIFSTDGKETLTTEKLSRLHDQATRAETDRLLKQSLYEEVKQGRVAQLPDAFADQKTAALQARLNELAVRAAELDVKFGPDKPEVREVKQQIATIEAQISESRRGLEEKLRADYERSVRDEQSLKAALARAKVEAVQQNQDAIQYNILKQEVDTTKELYTNFLQKTNQANIQLAEQHSNIKVVEPAVLSTSPVGPRRFRSIMIAMFLSLVAGVALALLLERLDNTIKSVEDVSRYTQLPALGIIPALALGARNGRSSKRRHKEIGIAAGVAPERMGAALPQLAALENRSSAAEAYRVLRTSVLLSSAGKPPRTILVTSSQPGEGKTTTASNTAVSMAQLGARVLIIDCDLRKPSAHKMFGVDYERGLSTYLSRDVDLEGLIQKLQIPNLSILPCGPIPPNPAELISSDRMKGMLRTLGEQYDHILIDSPPLMNVTDPVILSTMVDGVMLVVHGGKSTREVVRRARQELTTVGAKIFGVVLNNLDLRREGYNEYYYDRYYSDYVSDLEENVGD
ncbi:MAG TPA: polysaccharide biosynthesis tyrosine autokinase [Blastocatellia bacterium]|nr:polysaccharide biosynthesis tyrosine autokinase [Blastocatellia bacterium]